MSSSFFICYPQGTQHLYRTLTFELFVILQMLMSVTARLVKMVVAVSTDSTLSLVPVPQAIQELLVKQVSIIGCMDKR